MANGNSDANSANLRLLRVENGDIFDMNQCTVRGGRNDNTDLTGRSETRYRLKQASSARNDVIRSKGNVIGSWCYCNWALKV